MRATWVTWRAWAALVVALSACSSVRAFYFEGWPGSGLSAQQSLVPQAQSRSQPITAPQQPLPIDMPPVGPPVPIDMPPVGPNPTPEPATGLLGLLGLGAVALRKWRAKGK